ncbi:MAG: LPS export ABC transporter periplasmic protein LptC [Bacteroidetes bacterium]|nr:LPS export ABC transporter periplasmic protein LptC [Bacteroidota bacterium]
MSRKRTKNKLYWIPVITLMTGFLFSCVNDLNDVKKISYDPKDPSEVTKDLEVFFTDSGYPKIRLYAKLSETFNFPKEITKFRKGLRVEFFNPDGTLVSTLTAQYGEIQTSEGIMVVRDSVELYNFQKRQRLKTEELIWNQKDSVIYTNKSVVVTEPKGILYGQGIRTKQDFSEYTFIKPRGKIDMKK